MRDRGRRNTRETSSLRFKYGTNQLSDSLTPRYSTVYGKTMANIGPP